jgi:hypothetical protein
VIIPNGEQSGLHLLEGESDHGSLLQRCAADYRTFGFGSARKRQSDPDRYGLAPTGAGASPKVINNAPTSGETMITLGGLWPGSVEPV